MLIESDYFTIDRLEELSIFFRDFLLERLFSSLIDTLSLISILSEFYEERYDDPLLYFFESSELLS